ncbi:MAG: CotH kinase family protein [Bacteroidaceae bacterium]|nr:CotH kinase family protein [Bacteroidaceae bacterium]
MKFKHILLLLHLWCCLLIPALASPLVADGVYSISCQQVEGYVGLGAYHNVAPYICYVKDGQSKTEDAYWVVTYTDNGYTFQNEASGEWLIYTSERVDAYYKNMTLASDEPDDGSQYWNIEEDYDGSLNINSMMAPAWYWNLRASQGLLGTYSGGSRSVNERYYLTLKSDEPGPGPGPDPDPDPQPVTHFTFPAALHVYLTDGRIEAFPLEVVTSQKQANRKIVIETSTGATFTYNQAEVERLSEEAPADFPTFDSYKFNNKFNDQLFSDCPGEMVEDTVFLTVAAIGKRLTPSFKVPDDQTLVYVNGQLQDSKVSRLRFDKDIYYVVTRPGITMWLPDEETGAYSMQPYGRVVRVHVDWLTDRAEVPCIYINTADGGDIYSKSTFKDATISIDGRDIFPSMEETPVQIKGRGNSSWSWPKKPYRLKFAEKVKPLGMKKGKSWVLLSNYQTGSLMSNAIGMKAANLMEASAANHIIPVDLYLNGEYRGSYNLTEKVGFSNNSVDLEDETAAALLELDSYYDEPSGQKFRSDPYNLPINIKEPDFSEGTSSITLEDVETDFNEFMNTLYHGRDISRHVDIEQLVRFLMVNELIINYELYHPKSTFCYRESFESDTSKYVFGPVWDLDWGFGYERNRSYFRAEADYNYWTDGPNMEVVQFIRDLRFRYEPMSAVYQELWEKFMREDLQELLEYCQDYYDFAHVSFENNRSVWSDYTDYKQQALDAAEWLETRANRIYEDIINGVQPELEERVPEEELVTVTYDFIYDGRVIGTEEHKVARGRHMPAPYCASEFIYLETLEELPTLVEDDMHAAFQVIWTGPFEFTHSQADAHWYNMTIRSSYYCHTEESEPYYPTSDVDEETLDQPEFQWAFGGDPMNILVYNRATGLQQVLTLDGSGDDNQVNVLMSEGDYSWEVRPNSDGFVLSPHGYPNTCINQFGGGSGALQTWNDDNSPADDGSTFRIVREIETDFLLGDANGDGRVTITDAVYIVNYILQQPADDFQKEAADLNGDGKVTVTDAVMVINILLQQGQEVTSLQLFEGLEGEFTGIQHINSLTENHQAIFDLTGRQVKRPTKGVHIINGKKIVTK